jgi:Fe-S-cluster containining protein
MLEAMSSPVFALSIHADYKCRHSGACCTADWDVPVELPVYRSLDEQIRRGSLRVAPAAEPLLPFVVEADLPDGAAAMLERTHGGDCVFFERDSHLCVVHRDAGEESLPATCRHFPRLAVADARGTFVTLSHYCPTAASMLFREDVGLEIVERPPAFPAADYDGLTVTADDLPPLLSPSMLMDSDGYSAWERHMVRRSAADVLPESVVATLAADVSRLRSWRPGGISLVDAIRGLPDALTPVESHPTLAGSFDLRSEVVDAIPDDLKPAPDEAGLEEAYRDHVRPAWDAFARPINRYLAAKAFASWTAYQGRGLATIVRGLDAALALLRIESARQCRDAARPLDRDLLLEAFRSADFALNHLAVGEDLAAVWSRVEEHVR